jgi:CysZ protein
LPAIVASVLFVVSFWLLLRLAFAWTSELLPSAALWARALRVLADAILAACSLVASVFAALTVAAPLSSKALDSLVRAYEASRGIASSPPRTWGSAALRSISASAIGALLSGTLGAIALAVSVLAPPAAMVVSPVSTLLSTFVVTWNLIDYPLGLRDVALGARIGWMARHLALTLGFSLSAWLLLLVPGVGLLFLPAGVVGAAQLVERGGLTRGRIPSLAQGGLPPVERRSSRAEAGGLDR